MSVRDWLCRGFVLAVIGGETARADDPTAQKSGDVAAPTVKTGDSWTYRDTFDRKAAWRQVHQALTVTRSAPGSLEISSKEIGSDRPGLTFLIGADWARTRSLKGQETLVSEPVSFPLVKGKSWTIEFTEEHPDRIHESETFRSTYRVGDWEEVTVPAGTFHALKIEADGNWSAVLTPSNTTLNGTRSDSQGNTTLSQSQRIDKTTAAGRTYKAYWYVPAVKRWVKAEEDIFDPNGVRASSYTSELEGDKVAP